MLTTVQTVSRQRSFARSIAHQVRAHQIIPGASHTYAKGDDQFPENMAPVIANGQGCHVTDLDGNDFIEFGAGVRSITLGHGCKPVCDAAYQATLIGTNYTRPAEIELRAAEKMLGVLPRAEMIKFGKNGSDAVTSAIKLARAYTGREMVAVCGDHPFFSVDDWFIATTPMNAGIPGWALRQTVKFKYNDAASLTALFEKYPNQIAAVITEAETIEPPTPGFLHALQDIAHAHGALFILDETITGFRWHLGGAQEIFDLTPDLSTFGKAMANGFSVSALCGRREYMRLLGTQHTDRERCFAMSLTHGAETGPLAACIATIEAYEHCDVINTMIDRGTRLRAGVERAIAETGTGDYFQVMGRPQLLLFATLDQQRKRCQSFRTLFLQELLKRGVIAPNFVVNASHTPADITLAVEAIAGALGVYRAAIDEGIEKYLVGRPVQPVFRKFN